MNGVNLFSRLARYSQNPQKLSVENFCTEAVAHFFNNDRRFRGRFLRVIFADQRMAKAFRSAAATTQETLGPGCRVDLILRTGSNRMHLVEIKIEALESERSDSSGLEKSQIQRYVDLKLGNVTYLTTGKSLAPRVDDRGRKFKLVKHAFFEDLHSALKKAHISRLAEMFLMFMEENGMAAPQPFGRKELENADQAFSTALKCQKTLDIVRAKVNGQFRANLNVKADLSRATFEYGETSGHVQSYLKQRFAHPAVRWVGIALYAEAKELYFAVWLWGKRSLVINQIRERLGWDQWGDDRGCSSSIKLHGNGRDMPKMIEHAMTASRILGRVIKRRSEE